ncbi:MAG: hypothetical protein QXT45_05895 [Candidatus Bilamarchaeaceae archaeon]
MRLVKDVIRPGEYRKGNQVILVTDKDVKTLSESVKSLINSGYRIPAWMEHPSVTDRRAYPVRSEDHELVQRIENDPWFAGWVEDATVGSDGTLYLTAHYKNELGQALANVGTYVSPQFGRFYDPENQVELPVAIHHLAITRNPVNTSQTPEFRKTSIDRSYQFSDTVKVLSLTESVMESPVVMNQTDQPPVPNGPNQAAPTPQAPNNGQPQEQPAKDAREALLEALRAFGISLDEGSSVVSNEELLSRLLSLLGDYLVQKSREQTLDSPSNNKLNGGNVTSQPTVVSMSTDMTDIDRRIVQLSQTLVAQEETIKALKSQNESLMSLVTQQAREKYLERIRKVKETFRCPASAAAELESLATAYQFSANDTGKSELDIKLEVYESLPPNAAFGGAYAERMQFSGDKVAVASTATNNISSFFSNGELPESRVDEILKEYFGG